MVNIKKSRNMINWEMKRRRELVTNHLPLWKETCSLPWSKPPYGSWW